MRRKTKLGDFCIDCKVELNLSNYVYSGGYTRTRCKECLKKKYYKMDGETGFFTCNVCNQLKPPHQMKQLSSGYNLGACRDCFNAQQRKRRVEGEYERYKGRYSEGIKNRKLNQKYGINLEEFNQKLANQLNGCAICKEEFKSRDDAKVDHNHETGKVRDLLCLKCNFLVGFSREDEDLIWELLEYLKRHDERDERTFETINVSDKTE